MTGVRLDTKSVSHQVHKQWLVSLVLLWLVVETLWHIRRGDLLNPDIEAAAQAEAAR